jgi:hypothetical protein
MSSRLEELADRRRALVAQSDALRLRLTDSAQGIKGIFGVADLGVAAGRAVAHRPLLLLLAGVGAALFVLKRGHAMRTLGGALTAISLLGQVRRLLSKRR